MELDISTVAARFYGRAIQADRLSVRALLGLARSKFELEAYADSYKAYVRASTIDDSKTEEFKTAWRKLRNNGKSRLAKKFQSGLGDCMNRQPASYIPDNQPV